MLDDYRDAKSLRERVQRRLDFQTTPEMVPLDVKRIKSEDNSETIM